MLHTEYVEKEYKRVLACLNSLIDSGVVSREDVEAYLGKVDDYRLEAAANKLMVEMFFANTHN